MNIIIGTDILLLYNSIGVGIGGARGPWPPQPKCNGIFYFNALSAEKQFNYYDN